MTDLKTTVERLRARSCPECASKKVSYVFGTAKCNKCGKSMKIDEARKIVEDYLKDNR